VFTQFMTNVQGQFSDFSSSVTDCLPSASGKEESHRSQSLKRLCYWPWSWYFQENARRPRLQGHKTGAAEIILWARTEANWRSRKSSSSWWLYHGPYSFSQM